MNDYARIRLVDWEGKPVNHSLQDEWGSQSFIQGAVECMKQGSND